MATAINSQTGSRVKRKDRRPRFRDPVSWLPGRH